MKKKSAFTIIEILAVVLITSIILGLLVVGVKKGIHKTKITACQRNIKNIITALNLYLDDFPDVDRPPGAALNDIYGALYYTSQSSRGTQGGITNNYNYVCPATNHVPAKFDSYTKRLITNQSFANGFTNIIDYSIIKHQNDPYNSTSNNFYPNFRLMPFSNAVIWEAYLNNHGSGRNIGFWNGSVKYIASDNPDVYPTNVDLLSGNVESLTIHYLVTTDTDGKGVRVINPWD